MCQIPGVHNPPISLLNPLSAGGLVIERDTSELFPSDAILNYKLLVGPTIIG